MPPIARLPRSFLDEHARWQAARESFRHAGSGVELLSFHGDFLARVLQWYRVQGADLALVRPWSAIPDGMKDPALGWTDALAWAEERLLRAPESFSSSDELGLFVTACGLEAFVHRAGARWFREPALADPATAPQSTVFYAWRGLVDESWRRLHSAGTLAGGACARRGADEAEAYAGADAHWWVGGAEGGLADALSPALAGFGHRSGDGRPFWTGAFTAAGASELLFYFPADGSWWIAGERGGRAGASFAGNTAERGRAPEGCPTWVADFDGDGLDEVLFHDPSDGAWWMGGWDGGAVEWRSLGAPGSTARAAGHVAWTGRFLGTAAADLLLFDPRVGEWWVAAVEDGTLRRRFAGGAAELGAAPAECPTWVGDLDGDGTDAILLHRPVEGDWWTARVTGGALRWAPVYATPRDGAARPADFVAGGAAGALAYHAGTGAWRRSAVDADTALRTRVPALAVARAEAGPPAELAGAA